METIAPNSCINMNSAYSGSHTVPPRTQTLSIVFLFCHDHYAAALEARTTTVRTAPPDSIGFVLPLGRGADVANSAKVLHVS